MLHSSKKSSLLTPKIGTKNIYAPINMLIGVTIIIASIFNGVISHSPYEPSDIGKNVLLIDGQQRITTISLLLLAVYCKDSDQDSKDAYRKEYFKIVFQNWTIKFEKLHMILQYLSLILL